MHSYGSTYTYLPKSKMRYLQEKFAGAHPSISAARTEEIAAKEVDANILRISLAPLEDVSLYATGDPFPCPNCGCYFSVISKDHIVKEATDTFWNCEFCFAKSKLLLVENEYPTKNETSYILSPPLPPEELKMEEEKVMPIKEDDCTVIFCIDTSGSMNDSVVMSAGAPMKYMKNPGSISRLEAVQAAIDAQITKMAKEAPNRKVGFLTFGTEITLIGDGTQNPLVIPSNLMNDFKGIMDFIGGYSQTYLSKTVKDNSIVLLEKLAKISAAGITALGPALVASVSLAVKGSAGSRVIICTDGLANNGIGRIKDSPKDQAAIIEFYTSLGQLAQKRNVIVSIISLVNAECRLDLLSPISGITGGDIMRVDPLTLSKDFSSLLAEKIIATQVSVKIVLPKIMQFTNIPEQYLSADKTKYIQDIGSATKDSIVTCNYSMRPVVELEQIKEIDFKTIKTLPLQSQVTYRTMDGRKCLKVVTQLVKCTEEIKEVKKDLDYEVIKSTAIQTTAKYAKHGNYGEAVNQARRISSIVEAPKEREAIEKHITPITQAVKSQIEYKESHGTNLQLDEVTTQIHQAIKKS